MTEHPRAELIVTGGKIYTSDPAREWAEAIGVAGGKIVAVGTDSEVRALAGASTQILVLGGQLVLPGFSDGHSHLGLGGGQVAWELPILPTDSKEALLEKVRSWGEQLGQDEWIIGGIVGATVMDEIMTTADLAALDAAAGGRPVLLRDDSMHNRWVNSRALEVMGVGTDTPDPEGGTYVRDESGALTGVLHELASAVAEAAADAAAQTRTPATRSRSRPHCGRSTRSVSPPCRTPRPWHIPGRRSAHWKPMAKSLPGWSARCRPATSSKQVSWAKNCSGSLTPTAAPTCAPTS